MIIVLILTMATIVPTILAIAQKEFKTFQSNVTMTTLVQMILVILPLDVYSPL
jgi:hypothetical protein